VLITQAEFARLAGVSRSAVKQAINSGLISAVVEQGGKFLIDKTNGLQQYQANSRRQRNPKAVTPTSATLANEDDLELLSWGQAPEPVAKNKPAAEPTKPSRENLPEYGKSRARSEYERANLLELERKQKERLLLPADQVERVWANSVTIARTKLLGVPTRLRQRIPHLALEEIAIAEELIRESLEELAGGEGDGE